MKLQCNVCELSPIVEITGEPKNADDIVTCPNCEKSMAWARKKGRKLEWYPIHTDFDKSFGGHPITVISRD